MLLSIKHSRSILVVSVWCLVSKIVRSAGLEPRKAQVNVGTYVRLVNLHQIVYAVDRCLYTTTTFIKR